MSVTVVSCVYGDYARFIPEWAESIRALERQPEHVIVTTDSLAVEVPRARVVASQCPWTHQQAYYLQEAITWAETEWVWIVDIDDLALPDGLNGIDEVAADVWQMGYLRADGEAFVSPQLTAAEYLESDGNCFPAGSALRTAAFQECGGFPDVAFQDWGLWRRLAQHGMTFESSGRAHYRYRRHGATRSATELTPDLRAKHMWEMVESEPALA